MIYLYRVSGKDKYIRHSGVTPEGRIHVAVMDESYEEKVLLSLVLPEFILTSNKLDQDECHEYLHFIINKYQSIVNNVKDEKDLKKFFKRGDDFVYDEGLESLDEYKKLIRYKAHKIVKSYKTIGISPLERVRRFIRKKILDKY